MGLEGRLRPILAAVPALLLTPTVQAQTWTPVGPPGGDVRALASDPRRPQFVYLGTADGVLYRSEDGGRRWSRVDPGFPFRGMSLDDIVVDAHGRVVVGYWEVSGSGGGVAVSTDGGRTFAVENGLAGQPVRALAVAPSDPDMIVAGTSTGVFRSRDGGRSWDRISPRDHPEIRNLNSVAVDPLDPEVVYAGTWHLAWKTQDGGRLWRPIHGGMINDSDVMTLNVDRQDASRVYATACSGIYRSVDGGARWVRIQGIPSSSRRTRAFAQDPARPQALFAGTTEGLWASEDGGGSWRALTPLQLVVNAVAVLPGPTVVLGTEGAGVLRSEDAGRTWAAANEGFSERLVSRVVFDRERGRVLAGILGDRRHGGVFAAPAAGGAWERLGAGLDGREVLSLALQGASVLAATDGGLFALEGERWTRLPMVVRGIDPRPRIDDVAVLPSGVLVVATPRGLLRSADGGRTWEHPALAPAAAATALAASARERDMVLAATSLGLFRSRNAATAWERVSLPFADSPVRALLLLPGKEDVVFAATARGLFRSGDGGRSWSRRGGGLPYSYIAGLAADPSGRAVYASDFAHGGIFRSEDEGLTWSRLPTKGLTSDRAWSLASDPSAPGALLAATASGGLHRWSSSAPAQATGSQ
jgi:photosystem II stability/assembly factor-like uncharacterized protein